MKISLHQPWLQKWKIPTRFGPVLRSQVTQLPAFELVGDIREMSVAGQQSF
jgi:hypothetical protein